MHDPSTTPTRPTDELPEWVIDAPARLFFGGSFDPPHLGHAALPAHVATELAPRVGCPPSQIPVVYVPASRSPHKPNPPAPDADRVEMLVKTLESSRHAACIWTTELTRGANNNGAPSYWLETWNLQRRLCTNGPSYFLIGADQALSMHRWHAYEQFWRDAIVMLRDAHDSSQTLINELAALRVWSDSELEHWTNACVTTPMVDMSSSTIRTMLKTNASPINGLASGVEAYIVSHGLYTH